MFSRQPSNLRGGNVYFVGLGLPFPNLYCCAWSRKDLVCWEPPFLLALLGFFVFFFLFSRSAVSSLLPPSCAQMFNPLSFCELPDRTLLCSVVEVFFCLLLIPFCLKTHSSLQLSLLFCSSWTRGWRKAYSSTDVSLTTSNGPLVQQLHWSFLIHSLSRTSRPLLFSLLKPSASLLSSLFQIS